MAIYIYKRLPFIAIVISRMCSDSSGSFLLSILQELMQQMASVEYTENVTDDQLEALAGGEGLRYQASAFGVTKNNKVKRTRSEIFFSERLLADHSSKLGDRL